MNNRQRQGLILVVDDITSNLEIICDLLINAGFQTVTASNADSALRKINTILPDLILLDVMMPGIDGFETCRKLKENPQTSDIPVIFMTGITDNESKIKGFNLGAVDYIIKPFQPEEVLARIKTQMQLHNLNKNLEMEVAKRTAELSQALKELQGSQYQLIQKEKMSALGNLVAGVAHEINNPMGFIAGNLQPAIEHIHDLFRVIDLYQKYYPEPIPELSEELAEIDLEYLRDDLPHLISSMQEGVKRIRNISSSLRDFSRADSDRKTAFNIHDGIDNTLLILKHRLKATSDRPEIQVIQNYGNLPLVECFPGQINQVFMNILANAIDAIDELGDKTDFQDIKNYHQPKIWIHTSLNQNSTATIIRIKDNGVGMSEEVNHKAFDYLFTTKPVGKGTGLGLSITHQIVVENHGGSLKFNSIKGIGTEFMIEIPLK
ncbi:MAG TPA: response regulator [Nostocaceae cyanobacterium]|nr:response regulator [Nostocaceae cyanobacterium]